LDINGFSSLIGTPKALHGQNKNVYNQNLTTFLKICNALGVPIKDEKPFMSKQL
jgi:hypothetical protein